MPSENQITWGICIIADLGCNSKETRFNKELEKLVTYLEEAGRDSYITLIVNSQYGFLKKIMPNENRADIGDSAIRAVVFRNKNEPELLEFKDISESDVIMDLIQRHHLSQVDTKFKALFMWGHGMAYSMFKKSEDHSVPDFTDQINEAKYFEMINGSGLNNIFYNKMSPIKLMSENIKFNNAIIDEMTHDMEIAESKNYLSMDELASAILGSYKKKIALLVLSSCGMAYSRGGLSLSRACEYWLAGETYVDSYDIMPANLIASLKQYNEGSTVKSFAESLYTSASVQHFKLFDMSQFGEYDRQLKKLSISLYNSMNEDKNEIRAARNNCSPIGNATHEYNLVSFFDFCDQLKKNNSNKLTQAKAIASELLVFKNNLIITMNHNNNFGLSIFFPKTPKLLQAMNINAKEILGENQDDIAKFELYTWEFFILNLLQE
jgi:hypothetical protein